MPFNPIASHLLYWHHAQVLMNRRRLSSLIVALFFATHGLAYDHSIPEATPHTFVGGPENLELVTAATSITAFRIIDPKQNSKRRKLVKIDGQKCDTASSVVRGPEVTQVIGALSDMTNFGGAFMCDFDPGVILRFTAAGRTLDLVICFHCHEMVLCSNGAVVRRPYKWAATKNSFRKDARRAFVVIAKKAFPNDAEIKTLKQ